MRAVSTAVDAVVFFLLVSAAAGTLLVAPSTGPPDGSAPATAAVLTSSTVSVSYSPDGGSRRTIAATPAHLLARSAVAATTVDGRRLGPVAEGFDRSIREPVLATARHRSHHVQLRAVWQPFDRSELVGTTVVGDTPPPTTDVDAAVVTVPSGLPPVRGRAIAAAKDDGFDGVAHVVASAVVSGLFPPERTRVALYSEGVTSDRTALHYQRVADTLDVDVHSSVQAAAVSVANRRLTERLARSLSSDFRRAFDDPETAARAVSVSDVRIVVRTWSA